jgi:two-component system heavy metal sensor histidine kinase CusS
VLRVYAGDLLLALGGALLATLLGYVIVHRSMRRLRSVVAKANDISTSRMNTRLSVRMRRSSCANWARPSTPC